MTDNKNTKLFEALNSIKAPESNHNPINFISVANRRIESSEVENLESVLESVREDRDLAVSYLLKVGSAIKSYYDSDACYDNGERADTEDYLDDLLRAIDIL